MKHLEYTKFDCGDCSSAFYTEAEREHHCKMKSHMHVFTVRLHPWKEMMLTSLIRDTNNLEVYEEATVLKHRLRLMDELDDFLLNNVAKKDGRTGAQPVRTPVQEASRSNSSTRSSSPKSSMGSRTDTLALERSQGPSELSEVSLPVVRQSTDPEIEHRARKRTETDSSIDIDSVRAENRDGVDLPNTTAPPPLYAPSFSDTDSSDSDAGVVKSQKVGSPDSAGKAKEFKKKEEEERRRKYEEEERQMELKRKAEKKRKEEEERQKEEEEMEGNRLKKAKRDETEQDDRDRAAAEREKMAPRKLELPHRSVKEDVEDIDDEVQCKCPNAEIEQRVKWEPIFVQKTELSTPPPPHKRTLLEAPGGSHLDPQVPMKRALLTTSSGAHLPSADNNDNENSFPIDRDLPWPSLPASVAPNVHIPPTVLAKFSEAYEKEQEKHGERTRRLSKSSSRSKKCIKMIREGQFTVVAWSRAVGMNRSEAIIRGKEESPVQLSTDQMNNLRKLYDDFVAGNIANGKESGELTITQSRECQLALRKAAKAAWEARSTVTAPK